MDQPQATAASQNNVELPFDLKHDESKNSESAINIEDRQMDTDTHRLNQSENSEGFLAGLKLRQQMGIEPARKTKAPKEVRDAMAKKFYCLRPGNFEHAVDDVRQYMDAATDGTFLSAWLLTEVDHWDHEKERLVIITDKQLLIIRYNFIALRIEDCKRVALQRIQKIQSGRFVYPKNSLMIYRHKCLVDRLLSQSYKVLRLEKSFQKFYGRYQDFIEKCHRTREFQTGIRISWDLNIQMSVWQRWNPIFNQATFVTFTQHRAIPLLDKVPPYTLYEDFKQALILAVEGTGATFDAVLQEIPLEVYVGVMSMFHNMNELGFSKDRGSVSF